MPYRNRKLLDLAMDQACVMCGAMDGTVVSAHSNLQEHGKGMGQKADDSMTAWLCYRCHSRLDHGSDMTKQERRDFTLTAICRTVNQLWQQELIRIRSGKD